MVSLSSDETGEATVPASVTILNGFTSVGFVVTAVDEAVADGTQTVTITATATARWTTGVEMEALVAVSAACLAIYDMAKAVDRAMTIGEVQLLRKSGGRSGTWTRRG